jgi:hypothetical protein
MIKALDYFQGFFFGRKYCMTQSIRVKTDFDCRPTGITGHFRPNILPITDQQEQAIIDQSTWLRSRNQQRNWETIMQLISLYTQPLRVSRVRLADLQWQFEFDTDVEDVFRLGDDPVGRLKQACTGVPVINYVEQELTTLLRPDVNIWFEPMEHK